MNNPELTRLAGEFVSSLSFENLPETAVDVVRLGFADTLGVILAGRDEPVSVITAKYAEQSLAKGNTPWLFGKGSGCPEAAALVDATAAHALDFDDYAYSNHVSAVMVPAILACANGAPDPSGKRMVSAYVAGYEVWGDLMSREPDHLHSKGWHPTAVFGPVAVAACASHMLGLDAARTANALALAASHSSGLMANFGSMTKPYHAGIAAEAGIRSARLSALGLTAQPVALESGVGLLSALSPDRRVNLSRDPSFGSPFRIEKTRINIKKYPTVGASQRSIDAVLALKAGQEELPAPADIVEIVPRVSVKHAAVMPFNTPRLPAEAKFSLPFACAAAYLWERVGLAELTEEKLSDPQLRELMGKVRVDAVEDYDPEYPVATPFDIVTIRTRDGRTIESPKIYKFTGHAEKPLTREQHWEKFADCAAAGGVGKETARDMFDRAMSVETAGGPEELTPSI